MTADYQGLVTKWREEANEFSDCECYRCETLRECADKLAEVIARNVQPSPDAGSPVPIYLTCPKCGMVHVDEGEWATRPHKTHQCQECFHEWRPFPYATVGIPAEARQVPVGPAKEEK